MKNRDYLFDNAKGLMIFAVVLGHILEADLTGIARGVYVVIYSVHMPLFVMISGYFARFDADKIVKKIIAPYLCIQLVCGICVSFLVNVEGMSAQLTTPFWYLWYLPALAVWKISVLFVDTECVKKQRLILLGSVFVALLVGYDDTVGYYMSLSRIIVFYPYFLLGYYARKAKEQESRVYRIFAKMDRWKCMAVLTFCVVLIFAISPMIDYRWLYGSYSYSELGYAPIHRVIGYILGAVQCLCLLKIISCKKSYLSEVGKNSMYIYLGHAPGIFLVQKLWEKADYFINIKPEISLLGMALDFGCARQLLWIGVAVAGAAFVVWCGKPVGKVLCGMGDGSFWRGLISQIKLKTKAVYFNTFLLNSSKEKY